MILSLLSVYLLFSVVANISNNLNNNNNNNNDNNLNFVQQQNNNLNMNLNIINQVRISSISFYLFNLPIILDVCLSEIIWEKDTHAFDGLEICFFSLEWYLWPISIFKNVLTLDDFD